MFWSTLIGATLVLPCLHFFLQLWVPPTIAAVAMNLTYVEASWKSNKIGLSTELAVSLCLISVTLVGYFFELPTFIIAAICCLGFGT